jgi:hypothetical protein
MDIGGVRGRYVRLRSPPSLSLGRYAYLSMTKRSTHPRITRQKGWEDSRFETRGADDARLSAPC